MPLNLTEDDLKELQARGINPDDLVELPPDKLGVGETIKRRLVGNAGGIAGGGAGFLAGTAAGTAIGAPFGGVGAIPGGVIGGLIGGLGLGGVGAYAGEKAQHAILSDDLNNTLAEQSQEAEQQHPYISAATDLTANMLAAGGKPSLSNIGRAVRGLISKEALSAGDAALLEGLGKGTGEHLTQEGRSLIARQAGDKLALQKVATGALLNPTIETGMSLAQGQGVPSLGSLAKSATGGALFSEQNTLGKKVLGDHSIQEEQLPEPLAKGDPTDMTGVEGLDAAPAPSSPYKALGEDGQPLIPNKMVNEAFLKLNPKPSVKNQTDTDGYVARANWEKSVKIPIEEKREVLHQKYIEQLSRKPEPTPEPLKMEEDTSPDKTSVEAVDSPEELQKQLEQSGDVSQTPQSDKERYDSIQNQLRTIGLENAHTEEFQNLWKESESLKNRNKGFVPAVKEVKLPVMEDNYLKPLNNYSKRLYRETSTDDAENYLPNTRTSTPRQEHYASNTENLAHGQSNNKGVILEFGTEGLQGQVNTSKPLWKHVYDTGEAEFKIRHATSEEIGKNLESITVLKNAKTSKIGKIILKQRLNDLESKGWTKTETERGIKWSRPIEPVVETNTTETPHHVETPLRLIAHIRSQQGTTGSVLQHFASEPNHPFAPLAMELLRIGDKEGLATPWAYNTTERSNYNPNTDTVNIAPVNAINARAMMEEAIHSLSSKKIGMFGNANGEVLYNKMQTYLKNGDNEGLKSLIRAYTDTAKHLGIHDELFKDTSSMIEREGDMLANKGLAGNPDAVQAMSGRAGKGGDIGYAMGSLDEFLTHAFRTPDFQKMLNEMPSGIKGQSMWQRIVQAVRHMLGMEVKSGNMLEHVLNVSSDIIAQERPNERRIQLPPGEEVNPDHGVGTIQAPKEDEHMGKIGMLTRDVISRVHDLDHPGAEPLATATKQYLNEADRLKGITKNPILELGNKLSKSDLESIQKARDVQAATGADQRGMLTNDKQRAYFDLAKQKYSENGDYRIASKEPVIAGGVPRLLKKDPNYIAGMANQKVNDIYTNATDHTAIAKLDKVFDDWNQKKLGMTPSQSAERIDNWKKPIQGNLDTNRSSNQSHFNASRKAMGSPLPPEFRETNPVKNDSRYFDRQAIDNAHYRFVESNPKAMAALGETKDAWGKDIPQYKEGSLSNNAQVKALLNQTVKPTTDSADPLEHSISSIATSSLISAPPIEVHKIISNQVKAAGYADNPYQMVRMLSHGITNIKQGYRHALEGNVMKLSAVSAKDMFDGTLTGAQRMMGVSKAVRNVATLGELTTKFNAGLLQSQYEYLIPSKLQRANAGDKTSQGLIKRLDPTYKVGKTYTTEEQKALASQLANYTHGTADIRSMPSWMMSDSEISGFFKLAHWSVAQTNNFMHDVWTPATRGDVTPLIMSVFGAVAGGYIIKTLREDIQGKKSTIPSLTEIASSDRGLKGNAGPLAYNAIAAMQFSGFGGLLSQVAKYPFDFVYKNKPQGATFPLDELASDLAGTFRDVGDAIANDPHLNWVDLASAVTKHTLSTNFQLARIAMNQGINAGIITGLPAEQKNLSDRLNQLRRFNMVEGLPYNAIEQGGNPYLNIEQKKYKHTEDIGEAVKMLPGLIHNIMEKYHDNPDVMLSKLEALKQNSYSTFPSMENTPISFMKYIGFLQKSEGAKAAHTALQDYMRHKAINAVKSGIVP